MVDKIPSTFDKIIPDVSQIPSKVDDLPDKAEIVANKFPLVVKDLVTNKRRKAIIFLSSSLFLMVLVFLVYIQFQKSTSNNSIISQNQKNNTVSSINSGNTDSKLQIKNNEPFFITAFKNTPQFIAEMN